MLALGQVSRCENTEKITSRKERNLRQPYGELVPLPPKGIVTVSLYRKVDIRRYIGGWSRKGLPSGTLEPYEGKLSCPVLRGLGSVMTPGYPVQEILSVQQIV